MTFVQRLKKYSCIFLFIAANLLLLLVLKLIFTFHHFGVYSEAEFQEVFVKDYKLVTWFSIHSHEFLSFWLLIFLLVNTGSLYFAVHKYGLKREIFLATSVTFIILVIAEFVLKKQGYQPGKHTNVRYFTPVDSLYLLEGFTADSLGILKVDFKARQTIAENINLKNSFYEKIKTHEIYSLAGESIKLIEKDVDNNFAIFYKNVEQKNPDDLSEFERAIMQYVYKPINTDGFRSIAFKGYSSSNKKILLLGDSFTWGHSTSGKFNSFADELLAKGYVVYNTGISATDVAQYLAIARTYIPLLKPDVVIVNFFLGNDVTYYKREVKPFTPLIFPTNAGNLIACPQGKYFEDVKEAYLLNLHQWQIPVDDNILNKLMAKTIITTLLWRVLAKLEIVNYGLSDIGMYYHEAEKRKYKKPYSDIELRQIKEIAEQNGARFILSSIPEVYTYTFKTKRNFPDVFENLDYIEMKVTRDDYKLDDGHFNNKGHKRYADFLMQEIEKHE
ncbi:MAG: SGNH/GDSL hydrolase family protein [Bacteroidia bacterium]